VEVVFNKLKIKEVLTIYKHEKEFLKASVKAGQVYVNKIFSIGKLNVYSPIKQVNMPKEQREQYEGN